MKSLLWWWHPSLFLCNLLILVKISLNNVSQENYNSKKKLKHMSNHQKIVPFHFELKEKMSSGSSFWNINIVRPSVMTEQNIFVI